jgi:hypothetical protein
MMYSAGTLTVIALALTCAIGPKSVIGKFSRTPSMMNFLTPHHSNQFPSLNTHNAWLCVRAEDALVLETTPIICNYVYHHCAAVHMLSVPINPS